MTIDKMIEFVGVVRKVTASEIRTYQIEATGKTISGAAVLIWHKDSKNMQAILDIFRGGKAPLADAPEQQFETTTTTSTLPHSTTTVEVTGSVGGHVGGAVARCRARTATTAAATGDTREIECPEDGDRPRPDDRVDRESPDRTAIEFRH